MPKTTRSIDPTGMRHLLPISQAGQAFLQQTPESSRTSFLSSSSQALTPTPGPHEYLWRSLATFRNGTQDWRPLQPRLSKASALDPGLGQGTVLGAPSSTSPLPPAPSCGSWGPLSLHAQHGAEVGDNTHLFIHIIHVKPQTPKINNK